MFSKRIQNSDAFDSQEYSGLGNHSRQRWGQLTASQSLTTERELESQPVQSLSRPKSWSEDHRYQPGWPMLASHK